MYNVSNDYLSKINSGIIKSKITFTVSGSNTVYGDDNILKGSFSITNQSTDTKDVVLGAVYVGQLTATLRGVSVPRNSWRNVVITPSFNLEIANNTWESVPLGVYVVSEATHSKSGTQIKAYDNMGKFDKPMSMNQSSGYLYDFLALACQACNVTLGQTEQQLKALPNGSTVFQFFSKSDVETWRDLISWVAQTCGGFATINRAGQLEIRTYGSEAVKTFSPQERITGGEFSDYTTHYTGISYVDVEKEQTRYQGLEVDDGITMNLGANPFLQVRTTAQTAVQALLSVIADIEYTPFKMSILNNPIYDLGDVITFTGGIAGTSCTCCIMKYEFVHHAKYSMMGYGANPEEASAKSKSDKNISGLMKSEEVRALDFYEYKNASDYDVTDRDKQICKLKLSANIDTRVQIHINIVMRVTGYSGQQWTDPQKNVTVTIKYIINNEEQTLKPEEVYDFGARKSDGSLWTKGHVMHLMYILPIEKNTSNTFVVKMNAVDGHVQINRGGVWAFASGLGLIGDSAWDGEVEVEDEVTTFDIGSVSFGGNVEENIETIIGTFIEETISDTVHQYDIGNVTFAENVIDDVRAAMHSTAYIRETEEGDTRLTENGDIRYTEEEVT